MKTIIFLTPLSCMIFLNSFALSEKNYKNKYECEYEFELNKSQVDPKFIDTCLEKLKENEKIAAIKILASSDYKGSLNYNKKLADQRLNNTYGQVSKKISDLTNKELISIGKSQELGKKVYITFHTEEKTSEKLTDNSQVVDTNNEHLKNAHTLTEKTSHNFEYFKEEKLYKLDFKRE